MQGLYHWARVQPDSVYLTQPVGERVIEYTWADVLDQVQRIAAHLNSLQLPPGSQIALLSKNCAHWIMADLAIWMAGHVSVPIYPSLTGESVRQILFHSEARLLFLGPLDDWPQMATGIADELPLISLPGSPPVARASQWGSLLASTAPRQDLVVRAADELAAIIYTSGSTGLPKGVMTSFAAISAGSQMLSPIGITAQDRMLSYLPLSHVFEAAIVLSGSLRFGFRVFFSEGLSTFSQDLRRARPTLFVSVPRLWLKFQQGIQQQMPARKLQRLLRIPVVRTLVRRKILRQLGLDQVRMAGSGSAPLPASVLAWYRDLGLELLEGYGMSENFSYSHISLPGRSRHGYVGNPLPEVEQRIGEQQEIQILTPGLFLGYFKEPEKTAETLTADGWLRTGDMGEIDAKGRLRITGRLKEVFKTSKGKYVVPAPIENKLMGSPHIEVVCVIGANQGQPLAVVVLSQAARESGDPSGIEQALAGIRDDVNRTLDGHEQLSHLVLAKEPWSIANGLLTPTLKVKRQAVERHYEAQVDHWVSSKKTLIWEQ